MTYLIMDTNQWIYLANGKDPITDNFQDGNHFKLLDRLTSLKNDNKVKLLISDLVKNEWERNKTSTQNYVQRIENQRNAMATQLRNAKKILEGRFDTEIETISAAITKKYTDEVERNLLHITQVETLLLGAEVYAVANETKIFAADWALDKKAPFIGDKSNSMADALLFFGAIEYIKSKIGRDWLQRLTYPDSIFVSGNKKDFSSSKNVDQIHEDLENSLNSVQMKYFRSLPVALIQVDKFILLEEEILSMEEDIEIWASGETSACLSCDGYDGDDYISIVTFGQPFEISNEDIFENTNQIAIEFDDLPPIQKIKTSIQIGYCQRCSTTHVKCKCGEIISLENSGDGDVIECEGCGISYQTFYDHDGDGLFEERIILAKG